MSDRMTWEEKLSACQALAECSLRMRKPGDWYVSHLVEVVNGPMLQSRYGNGGTPQDAVEDHWTQLTELKAHECLVVNSMTDQRREVRWNGYMWMNWTEPAHVR